MSSSLEQMYQQVILDHAKSPHGRGFVELSEGHLHGESHQINPTCGDEVTMRVEFDTADPQSPTISSVSWEGQGCSISQASLSVLTDLVTGAPVAESEHLGDVFRQLMQSRGKGLDDDLEDQLGDATAFTGVAQFPARIKCALLGWAALRDTLATSGVLTDAHSTQQPALDQTTSPQSPQENR
ncbi:MULTISPECIES: Fe-S cluster assembly sulfur transfer protein SufU [Oerskovia]|uniref:SUF system NifU family Fe-S cluster assembly protein n=2 Tax=Oerskovia TaxID=162491 RepID=A0ABR8V4N3_9CELL|nr:MULTISPECIES: SUF system NifU family Fe-S cluster assembly protein [Oerskovia]MBD7999729.1 SUF system NifU family Fe-S cluster assembly protein [Oerskovia gallyi]MBM7497158.1 nitrogen fixation NifU-like protein [Oerskovia paurometabola]